MTFDSNISIVSDRNKKIIERDLLFFCTCCSLSVTLYVLFFIGFANPKSQVITVSSITPSLFDQLRLDHGESLSCPCSNTNMPYKTFVSHTISFHSVCSSVFVSRQWIEALYLHNASAFYIMDFRTTASSQVRHCLSPEHKSYAKDS